MMSRAGLEVEFDFARPRMIEYLIARKRHDQERPPVENYSFEHVCGWEESVD
jgi:hypothetical protein